MEYISDEHIEFYTDEKYQNLPYGTIYIVVGKLYGLKYDEYCQMRERIVDYIMDDSFNWLNSDVVILDTDNDMFEAKNMPTYYSPVLPTEDNLDKGTCFYVASLFPDVPSHFDYCIKDYNNQLRRIFDEILDTGEFPFHIIEKRRYPHIDFMIESAPEEPLPKTLSRLEITPTTYDILLPDYNKQFKFTAQVKALYVLFLLHPEGIRMKEWYKYKDKFSQLYFLFTNRSDVEKIRKSIDKLFDMYSTNALEVKKSQCNREVCYVIRDKNLQKYYVIEPSWARPHRIRLDRKLVTIPDYLR